MFNYYCFPLPYRTEKLLSLFATIAANGASLCVTDLFDGLCPLQLADELEQIIFNLCAD